MRKTQLLLSLVFVLLMTACSGGAQASVTPSAESTPSAEPVELYISAAASMTESLNKIAELYSAEAPNIKLTFNFGASGTLQTQIEEGAPADLFISAAQKQMDALADKDLIIADTRVNLLKNEVVLIIPKGSDKQIASFDDVLTDKVSMIAIGNPESVPVGQYAQDILTSMNAWDAVQSKVNLASDVREVLAWTETGNVDCGIVYSTDAATSEGVTVVAEAPADSHKPVVYPAALVKGGAHPAEAKSFLAFLGTDAAKQVFLDNGFLIAE